MTYRGMEFASSVVEDKPQMSSSNSLQLAPHVSETTKVALNALPCFKGADTTDLMLEAEAKMDGKRKISDRFTAMLVIAGTRYLDHPELQVPRKTAVDIGMSQYTK